MAGFKINANVTAFSRFAARMQKDGEQTQAALATAAKEAADEIEARGADDIESAGNFGSRWTEGLHADVQPGNDRITITVCHDIPFFSVFEYGKVIQGKPLLWIPFSDAADAKGVWPRAFGSPLFKVVSKKGLPILFAWTPGEAGSAEAKYFGKEQVTIPQKFHIRDIVKQVAKEVKSYFKEQMKV